MTNLQFLLNEIRHNVDITMPDDLWNNLYLRLQAYTTSLDRSHQSALLVEKAPLRIQIVTLQHHPVLEIPQAITDWRQTTRDHTFSQLPLSVQQQLQQITQAIIRQANQRRLKSRDPDLRWLSTRKGIRQCRL